MLPYSVAHLVDFITAVVSRPNPLPNETDMYKGKGLSPFAYFGLTLLKYTELSAIFNSVENDIYCIPNFVAF